MILFIASSFNKNLLFVNAHSSRSSVHSWWAALPATARIKSAGTTGCRQGSDPLRDEKRKAGKRCWCPAVEAGHTQPLAVDNKLVRGGHSIHKADEQVCYGHKHALFSRNGLSHSGLCHVYRHYPCWRPAPRWYWRSWRLKQAPS